MWSLINVVCEVGSSRRQLTSILFQFYFSISSFSAMVYNKKKQNEIWRKFFSPCFTNVNHILNEFLKKLGWNFIWHLNSTSMHFGVAKPRNAIRLICFHAVSEMAWEHIRIADKDWSIMLCCFRRATGATIYKNYTTQIDLFNEKNYFLKKFLICYNWYAI